MKEDILISFGDRVREIRKMKALTQEQVSEITGFHRTYIGMVERGERNPSLKNIEVFAKAFGITISELLKNC